MYVWDVASGALQGVVRAHLRGVTTLDFGPSGDHIISGGEDGTIHLWYVQAIVGLPSRASAGRLSAGAAGSAAAFGSASAGGSSQASSSSAAAKSVASPFTSGAAGRGMARESSARPAVTWRHGHLPVVAVQCMPGVLGGAFRFVACGQDGSVCRYFSSTVAAPEFRMKVPVGETPTCLSVDPVSGICLVGCESGSVAFVDPQAGAAAG